jgi:hypothetical protein
LKTTMKNDASACRALVYALSCLVMVSGSQAKATDTAAHTRLLPGLEYLHQRVGTGPLSIHVLKIDRGESRFAFAASLARGTVLGLQALSQQINDLDPNLGEALAAVNGDFFRIRSGPYQGDPRGLQLWRGELVSSPHKLSFWIDAEQRPHIGQVHADFKVFWPDKRSIPFAVNQEPDQDQAVLYTPTMGPSTRTTGGTELVLEQCPDSPWLPTRPGQTYRARVESVHRGGNASISRTRLVLHLNTAVARNLKPIESGTILSLSFKTSPDLRGLSTAISGGPLLVREGRPESFFGSQARHPRTAIGWSETHYILLVVDGRQKDLSIGMTFPELADYLLNLGCTEAMNLDGGGSSTFWMHGKIRNSPSDGRERRIANGLVLLKKPRD